MGGVSSCWGCKLGRHFSSCWNFMLESQPEIITIFLAVIFWNLEGCNDFFNQKLMIFVPPVTWRPVLHFDFSLAGNATDHKVGQEVWSRLMCWQIDMGYPPLNHLLDGLDKRSVVYFRHLEVDEVAQFGSDTVSGRRRRLIGFQTTWLQHESWEFQLEHARMHHFRDGNRWTSRGIRIRFTFKKSEGPRVTSIFAYPRSLSLSFLFLYPSPPFYRSIIYRRKPPWATTLS